MEKKDVLKVKSLITDEDLKAIKIELKYLDYEWQKKLCDQISANERLEERYRKISVTKLYMVFSGKIKNHGWKSVVYGQSKVLREKIIGQLEELKAVG